MKRFFLSIAFAAAAIVGLAACGSEDINKVNVTISSDKVQTGIALACGVYKGADAVWQSYSTANKVSDKAVKIAADAEVAVGTLCTPPYATDVATVVAKVTEAGAAVFSAINEAKLENGETASTLVEAQ